ncbi:hypothetical protein ON058_10865 [Demequina sp. B12]|uniref:hypothetical protein n=1 Tax=Demequina sp. B12 TaxID=2992757 RepID=UPI00237BF1CC|nr:hypothetical protein [Demequina sp. B12]MDE0573912.1 hypothetical protein [Demequina sp. B12]
MNKSRQHPLARLHSWSGAAAAFIVLGATACSPAASDAAADPDFAAYIDELLEEAHNEGASAQQIDILEQAKADGELTYEMALEANRNVVACLADVEIEAHVVEETTNYGLTIPGYAAQLGDGSSEESVTVCDQSEVYWTGQAYQLQPSSEALQSAYIAKQRPLVEACLTREGAEFDPNLNDQDLLVFALEYMDEHGTADCAFEAEIYGF